jgi:hypothetical protein
MSAFGWQKAHIGALDPSRKWFCWASVVPTLAVSHLSPQSYKKMFFAACLVSELL